MSRFIVIALVLASIASLATAQNCSVGSVDYFVPRLVSNATVLSSGSLYYVIEYNKAALSAVGNFYDASNVAAGAGCVFVPANTIATTGCVNTHTVNMSVTASQFTSCGFSASSTSSSATYTGRYKLITVENAGTLRGIMFNRTVESAILFQVSFATTVNATSGNVSVYGAAITEAVITSQLFDTSSYVANLQITTSVQFPYVLTGATVVGTNPQNFNTLSSASVSNGNCSSAFNSSCFQVFNLTLTPTSPCATGGASNLNNAAGQSWSLNFTVSCDASRINCTGTPNPGSVLVTFTTASPDYCPQVLGTITPTMTLTAYDGGNLIPQTFFVWGTQSYFRAVLSSPVDVEKVALTKVDLLSGAAASLASGNLYTRAYSSGSASAFWAANITDNTASSATVPVADSIVMRERSENNRTDPYVYFTVQWSSSISSASGDNPVDTQVYAEARIKYAGSTGSAERVIRQKINVLETATPTSMGARANVGVIQAESTPVSTAARSSSSSNMAIIAVASVGGAIAVLSVFAIVAIKRRRNSKEQQERMESVYLSRLETPATTA